MRRIKIFVDAHVFDHSYQGTSTYIKGIYTALVSDERFEITLAATNIERLKKDFTDQRFRFIALPHGSKYSRLLFEIPRLIRATGFDYAHFQYIVPLKKTCRYINTIHDLLFLDFPQFFPWSYRITKKFLFKYSARRSEMICTVSAYSKQALVNHFSIPEKNIVLTPNAVEVQNGSHVDIKARYGLDKYILFVSRLEPRKNHYLMLKAFTELELYKQGYQLVFIGRMVDVRTEVYHQYFSGLPEEVKRSVKNIENISYNELDSFYSQADLFVYPSAAEGFGIPPLEAAMAGCRVLCSNQTAMSDFDFFGPYLFDPGDQEEMKSKILKVLNEKNYPHLEIKRAITERYNWQTIAEGYGKKLLENFARTK